MHHELVISSEQINAITPKKSGTFVIEGANVGDTVAVIEDEGLGRSNNRIYRLVQTVSGNLATLVYDLDTSKRLADEWVQQLKKEPQ